MSDRHPRTPPRDPRRRVVALPGWWTTVQDAERQAPTSPLWSQAVTACTHVTDGIALVTLEVPLDAAPASNLRHEHRWAALARDAIADHAARYRGRLFVFPGQEHLRGDLSAREILEGSVIDELVVPGHPGPVDGATRVQRLDHARPVYRQGKVVLTLRPRQTGVLEPFEQFRAMPLTRSSI